MEFIRAFILVVGWPVLVLGSVYILIISLRFWRELEKGAVGRLVLGMVVGWLTTMYSLGITATAFMLYDLNHGIRVVLPIFLIWFATMIVIIWSVIRWSKEAATLNAFYKGLENLIKKRTEELEQTYQEQLKKEREMRELREKFVGIAAHELRTPVTAIEWGLQTILEDKNLQDKIPADYVTLLKDLRRKNQNLLELIVDILKLARVQKGKENFENEPVSVRKIAEEVRGLTSKLGEDMHLAVSWPIVEALLPPVPAHPIYLKEVLTNLVTNAIRYNKPQGWITVDAEQKGKEILIHVKDSGIGMTDEEMKNLFKEFYRVKNEETEHIDGTGLGLFMSRELMTRMGGTLTVHSEKGIGSIFTIRLKLK